VVNYEVAIAIEQGAELLKPDMTANVSIHTAQHDALLLPAAAVQHEGDQTFVYVAAKNGRERKAVAVGPKENGMVEIKKGIGPDDAVVVSGRVPDLDSSQILPVVEKLDAALDDVRKKHPGYEIAVTGLSAIAARNSANMIQKLNRGLTIEFALVAIFIGLAFRSVVVMFSCILPGIFPVVLSGTVLWLLGEGLQFASVVALTVSFGLGLSATIHFLNRLRLESRPGVTPELAVERATVLVGPALILTTVVLACGLVVTVFSDLPSLRLFGWLSAFSMVAALVADLFILRPTAMFLINLSQRLGGTASHGKPAE